MRRARHERPLGLLVVLKRLEDTLHFFGRQENGLADLQRTSVLIA